MDVYPGLNPESFSSSAQTAKSKHPRSTKNRHVPEIRFNVSRILYIELAVYNMKETLFRRLAGIQLVFCRKIPRRGDSASPEKQHIVLQAKRKLYARNLRNIF